MRIRFIGVADNGREIVRVDRGGADGSVRIATDAELQQVGDAPYFRDTIKLAAGRDLHHRRSALPNGTA